MDEGTYEVSQRGGPIIYPNKTEEFSPFASKFKNK